MEAEAVLLEAAKAYETALSDRLVAAYALGSLAHGGFSPLVSDIDLGLIVRDPVRAGDVERIEAEAEAERARGSALGERLSVFWGTRATLNGEAEGGRFPPLDRLDLIENGDCCGRSRERAGITRPGPDEGPIAGAEFALELLTGVRSTAGASAARLGSLRRVGGVDASSALARPPVS